MIRDAEHTPTPWAARPHWAECDKMEIYPLWPDEPEPAGEWAPVADVAGHDGEQETAEANAAFIVEAVNSYERLKAENEKLLKVLIKADELCTCFDNWSENIGDRDPWEVLTEFGPLVDQAIAAVGGRAALSEQKDTTNE